MKIHVTMLAMCRYFKKSICLVFGKKKPKKVLFLSAVRQYIQHELTVNEYTESTIKKYEAFLQNIEMYFKLSRQEHISAMEVKISHMEGFNLWLHQNLTSCSLTHAARHLELCKRALKHAVVMDLIPYNTLASLTAKRDKIKEVVSLEQEELNLFIKARFSGDMYVKVLHCYVFQCCSGVSYCDLNTYAITVDKHNQEWISGERQKSGMPYDVPLHPIAKLIHEFYDGQLPQIPNAVYNRILKEIAGQLGIKKHLTTHTARKTFATLKNNEGYSMEAIRDMLGQSSVKVTEAHYVTRSRKRIEKEKRVLEMA